MTTNRPAETTGQQAPADAAAARPPINVSDWYTSLAAFTFPTLFIALSEDEIAALLADTPPRQVANGVIERLDRAIAQLPGSCFVHADACAPTDALEQVRSSAMRTGRRAWSILRQSNKVRQAFEQGHTTTLGVHSHRRMDRVREFRWFVHDRELKAVSQKRLVRHYRRLAGRADYIWRESLRLAADVVPHLPVDDVCIDVYLTSEPSLMLLDMHRWGPPTDPLLLRDWDRDWRETIGLKLIPPPTELGGNVEVSF